MQSLFKPRVIQIKTSLPIDMLLERLKKDAIVDGNNFTINSRVFDPFYRSCYAVGKVDRSDLVNTINAEVRPTSHVKAGTFLFLVAICSGLIPLTLQIINGAITMKMFLLGILGIAVLFAAFCFMVRRMFMFSSSFIEQSVRKLVQN